MPTKATPALGNELVDMLLYAPAVTFPTIAANTISSNTFNLPGVMLNDFVSWSMISPPAHLAIENVYVSAANTLTITWSSDTTGISGSTVAVMFELVRLDGANLGLGAFPTAVT